MRHDLYGRKPQPYSSQNAFLPSGIFDIVDKDTALIFALIFLLKKEHRDPMLILALLYILT